MDKIKPYAKAAAAGAVAGLAAATQALIDGRVSPAEACVIASAAIVGTGLTYAVPNRKAR